jgi:Tfp pilus assembly protein PilF
MSNTEYKLLYDAHQTTSLDSVKLRTEKFLHNYPDYLAGWNFYGWVLFELNQPDSAITAYKRAIQISTTDASGYAGAGAVYNTLNQNDSAETYLLKAVELHDSSAYTFLNLSMLYMKKNERAKSYAYADSSFLRGDSLAAVCAGLSFVYHQQNEEIKSHKMYKRAMGLGLKDTTLFNKVLNGEIKIEDYYRNKY